MNILIFGCSAVIGQSITNEFSKGNNLVLVGRTKSKLKEIKNKAVENGALKVRIIEYDLAKDINDLINEIKNLNINLFINLASSTSRFRDNNIKSRNLIYDTNVDLINPISIIQFLVDQGHQIKVIFITSILSKINSPNRVIYSSLKNLQETYLKKIADHNPEKVHLLTVIIGTQIKIIKETKKSRLLAKKIYRAFLKEEKNIFFGFYGKLLWMTYLFSPLLFKSIIHFKRKIF